MAGELESWRAVHRYKCCSQSKQGGTIIHADTVRQSPAQLCTPHFSLSVVLCLYPTRDLGLDVIDGADEDGAPPPHRCLHRALFHRTLGVTTEVQ